MDSGPVRRLININRMVYGVNRIFCEANSEHASIKGIRQNCHTCVKLEVG